MWNDLSLPWQAAFEEAREAFRTGNIPIGAVICDTDGNIISRGHNELYSAARLNPKTRHAEMNCLDNLDIRKYPDIRSYILYTTMEPCPMCMGTLVMCNIRHLRYASRDNHCGAVHFASDDRYTADKHMDIGFGNSETEAVQLTLQIYSDFSRNKCITDNRVLAVFRKQCPEAYAAAVKLFKEGYLEGCIDNHTSMAEIYDYILCLCNTLRKQQISPIYTVRIEQTSDYPKRMKYIPGTDSFEAGPYDSLSYIRNVPEPYGWLTETGTPPHEHLDALVMTDKHYELGETDSVRVVGVFKRNDGDNKFVTVPIARDIYNLSELPEAERDDLHRLYPYEAPGEGWFDTPVAFELIRKYNSSRRRKVIITVQHCESVHHVNGMVGAWTDWELTENGHEQARNIGKWLAGEHNITSFRMYTSTLKRAIQTGDDINESLHLRDVILRDEIREVSAGMAHGKSFEWLQVNQAPHPEQYDPDYRSFPDSESDRDLWNRIYPFYREILDNDDELILIVSHGCTLSFLHSMLLGKQMEDLQRLRTHGHAGNVSKFLIDPEGKVTVEYLNRTVI